MNAWIKVQLNAVRSGTSHTSWMPGSPGVLIPYLSVFGYPPYLSFQPCLPF